MPGGRTATSRLSYARFSLVLIEQRVALAPRSDTSCTKQKGGRNSSVGPQDDLT